jgi:magnesium transporter
LLGVVAWAWLGQPRVSFSLLGAVVGGVAGAAAIGLAMPYVLRLLALNPQVAAGPVALTFADLITLLIYFNLARSLLA